MNYTNGQSGSGVNGISQEILERYASRDPWLASVLRLSSATGQVPSPEVMQMIHQRIAMLQAIEQANGTIHWPNQPGSGELTLEQDDIPLLELPYGNVLSIPSEKICQNLAIVGASGSGKTRAAWNVAMRLARMGATVVVADQKTESRGLLADSSVGAMTHVIGMDDLKLSLYQPIAGVSQNLVAAETTRLLGACLSKLTAHQLVSEAEQQLRADGQVGVDEGVPLTMLMDAINGTRKPSGRGADLKASILQGLRSLKMHLGNALDYRKSDFINQMTHQPGLFVLEAPGLPPNLYSFVILQFVMHSFLMRAQLPEHQRRPLIFVLDDATFAISKKGEQSHASGISPLTEKLLLTRERKIGFVLVAHTLSGLSDTIRQNMHSYLFCGSRGDDYRLLNQLLGINQAQYEHLRILKTQQAVGFVPSQWDYPVLGHVPSVELPRVSDEACRESAQQFLAGVTSVPYRSTVQSNGQQNATTAESTSPPSSRKSTIPDDELQVLLAANQPVPLTISQATDLCDFGRDKFTRLVQDLETKELIKSSKVPSGRRGASFRLISLTDKGIKALEAEGVTPISKSLHGSHLHSGTGVAFALIKRSQGYDVQYEVLVGNHRLDLYCRHKSTGDLLGVQVGVSDPKREAEAVIDVLGNLASTSWPIMVICLNRPFQESFQAQIDRSDLSESQRQRVQTCLLGEVLSQWYDALK